MNGNGVYFYQSAKYRIGDSDFFLGGNYVYADNKTSFDDPSIPIKIEDEYKTASIGILADYDTRDNTFSPDKGMLLNAEASFFREAIGGDDNFERYKLQGLFYNPLIEDLFIDLRVNYESIDGDDAPFFMYPSIDLRGIPAMRYQGENTLMSELQLRWNFKPRWSALVFGGVGKAYGKDPFNPLVDKSFSDASNRYTKGLGFRYLITKKYGLRMGIDIASSQEDEAVYIQFGTAWAGL